MKSLPTLYKKSSTGKIEQWQIRLQIYANPDQVWVETEYGELKGKQQSKSYEVMKGLNKGKKNETSKYQQAELEAQSKWLKKKKAGYVESLEDARAGKVDEVIKGGIAPMLAQDYDDHAKKIQFPCFVQPKLDGMRCIAMRIKGRVTLWSRGQRPILSCPHIIEDVKRILDHIPRDHDLFLDGELYNHDYADEFEKLMSAAKKQKPSEESKKLQLHVYDMCYLNGRNSIYQVRHNFIDELADYVVDSIIIVPTTIVYEPSVVQQYRKAYEDKGYEGMMLRNIDSKYEAGKRSYNLQKLKIWKDDEFDIVNVIRKKDNTVVFVCKTKDGIEFEATKTGVKKDNLKYVTRSVLWTGKKVNVRYFKYTKKNKVPKMGQAIYIRDEE